MANRNPTAASGSNPSSTTSQRRNVAFVTTHWSLVLAASGTGDAQASEALAKLCQNYWYPLYVFVRRRGYRAHDAEDLTQAFFARLLERHWLGRAEQAKGRFRTFLLTALERFLANEWDKVRARKRGGGKQMVPLQFAEAETRYGVEPVDERTPDQAFEYHWAVTLLAEVVRRLEREFQAHGQGVLFAALKPCLTGESGTQPYAALAAQLGQSESAVKVAVHRLRQRYRELLRAEIADTVASAQEVDAEMRHLFQVLAGT